MNFVIPMAGRGKRFFDAGFEVPKMLIEAKGKTLLEWSVDSLPLELCSNLIFVLLEDHEKNYGLSEIIQKKYAGNYEVHFVYLAETTRGQAETVVRAKNLIDFSKDLLIYNIDTAFSSVRLAEHLKNNTIDGVLGAFIDTSASIKYSFAKCNDDGLITEVAEKVHISDNALTGLYHFKKPADFFKIAEQHIALEQTSKGEFYIAPMYNDLIQEGKKFIIDQCDEIFILGTPEELEEFKGKI